MEAGTQSPNSVVPDGVTPEVADQVHRRRAARRAREEERDERLEDLTPGAAAVAKLSEDRPTVTEDEIHDATEWFLSDEESPRDFKTLTLNVGTDAKPLRIQWVIRSIDSDCVRRSRRESLVGTRAQKRAGIAQSDEVRFNALIAVEGSASPDLLDMAGDSREAAVDALRKRFRRKPGLIPQIAGAIMSLSGYDDDDVREVDAAGNSSS